MKHIMFFTLAILTWSALPAQKIDWVDFSYATVNFNVGTGITTDTSGNVYVLAEFENQIIIQTDTFNNQYGAKDLILLKYNSQGNLLWGKVMGGGGYDYGYELAMDAAQNLYASVFIQFVTQMNDTTYSAPYKSQVIQFDSDGNFKRYLSKNTFHFLLDAGGDNVYIAYNTSIEKLDTAFSSVWIRTITPANMSFGGNNTHNQIKLASNGHLLLSCVESGAGGTSFIDTVPITFSASGASNEVCVINMDTSGSAYWARTVDSLSVSAEQKPKIAMDDNGNVYLAFASGNNIIYFANDTLFNSVNPGASSYCAIFKFDAAGTPQWGRGLYSNYISEIHDLLINDQQELLLCGQVYYPAQLAGVNLSAPGTQKMYVAKLDGTGVLQWYKRDEYGSAGTRRFLEMILLPNGRYAATGLYTSSIVYPFQIGCYGSIPESVGIITTVISENPEPVPAAAFDMKFEGGVAYFENLSENDDNIEWLFGDGQTELTKRNPSHPYPVPGYYNACLVVANGCGSDSTCKSVIVPGIEKVTPRRLANSGYHLLKITGGFPFVSGTVKFIRNGQADIIPDTVIFRNPGLIQANLKLNQAPLGDWDLVIISGGFNDTLLNAITLELPDTAQIEVQVSGAGKTLVNTVWPFRITLTNRSNRTEIGFPLAITMNPDATIFTVHEELGDSISQVAIDSIGHFAVVVDSLSGDSSLFGGFLIPLLSPGETKTFRLMIQSPVLGTKTLTAQIGHSYFSQQNLNDMGLRVMSSCNFLPNCLSCALDILGFVPGLGCVTGTLNLGCAIGNGLRGGPGSGAADIIGSLAGTALSCAGPLGALDNVRKAYKTAAELSDLAGSISGFLGGCGLAGGCHFYSKDNWTWPNAASLDPNSKTGPLGLTPQNYVSRYKSLPYFIRFENVSSATAPAREVMITDTLDASVFDLSTFRFTSFAFGDSTYDLEIQDDLFVSDIDLRPAKNIILRVSGVLDTVSHAITWKFSSFDTTSYDLTMNVNDGFLPPNVNHPEGEGYVTYSIDPLPGLPHLQQLANRAHITFDANTPITTDVFINTIDTISPASQVDATPTVINDTTFVINWGGTDAHAGVNVYDIYISENDGPYQKIIQATSKTTAKLIGTFGNKYEFYSIATDHADNIEEPPLDPANSPDAVIMLNSVTEVTGSITIALSPNPVKSELTIRSSARIEGIRVFDVLGHEVYRSQPMVPSGEVILSTAHLPDGLYLVEILSGNHRTMKTFVKAH